MARGEHLSHPRHHLGHPLGALRLEVDHVDVALVGHVAEGREGDERRESRDLALLHRRGALHTLAEDPDHAKTQVEEAEGRIPRRFAAEELLPQLDRHQAHLVGVGVLALGEKEARLDHDIAHRGIGGSDPQHGERPRLAANRERLGGIQDRCDRRHALDPLGEHLDVGEAHFFGVDPVSGAVGDDQIRAHSLDQADHVLAAHQPDRYHGHHARGADRHAEHGERGPPPLAREAVPGEAQQELKPFRRVSGHRGRGSRARRPRPPRGCG